MKYALIWGAAATSLALAASAQPTPPPPPTAPHVMVVHRHDMDMDIDPNHDGWISRAEAAAAADRMFDHLDTNHDGRLTPEDRPVWGDEQAMAPPESGDCQTSSDDHAQGEHRVTVICRSESAETGEDASRAASAHRERHVVIVHGPMSTVEHSETRIIVRNDDDVAAPEAPEPPEAPRPPHPPHAPMLMMLFANSEEADANHDGVLSRDEFRAQQLRFFDASDANHDGKIRFEPPPMPPELPEAPAPVAPPEPPRAPAPHY